MYFIEGPNSYIVEPFAAVIMLAIFQSVSSCTPHLRDVLPFLKSELEENKSS